MLKVVSLSTTKIRIPSKQRNNEDNSSGFLPYWLSHLDNVSITGAPFLEKRCIILLSNLFGKLFTHSPLNMTETGVAKALSKCALAFWERHPSADGLFYQLYVATCPCIVDFVGFFVDSKNEILMSLHVWLAERKSVLMFAKILIFNMKCNIFATSKKIFIKYFTLLVVR